MSSEEPPIPQRPPGRATIDLAGQMFADDAETRTADEIDHLVTCLLTLETR